MVQAGGLLIVGVVALGAKDKQWTEVNVTHECTNALENVSKVHIKPLSCYDHVSALWELEGWIDSTAASLARANYGAYMVQRGDGLRVITLNTDFWYE